MPDPHDPGDGPIRRAIRLATLGLSIGSGVWALGLGIFGGINFQLAGRLITSNDFRRPLLYASLLMTLYLLAGGRVPTWTVDWTVVRRLRAPRWLRSKDVAAGFAVVASVLIVLQWIAAQPLWLDEEMIAINIRDRALDRMAGELWLGQTAPLGWLVVQRLVLLGFGTGEVALRFVPVLFGIGTLAVVVWIGRRWLHPIAAAILVLLFAFAYWITFHALELKPYSADVFWAVLLPALAAWAVSPAASPDSLRRVAIWWVAAAVGQWFAVGAVLVTPGCAIALIATFLRRAGWSATIRAALPGVVWVASFGLNYYLSLQYTAGSKYLHSYWAMAMPPDSAGVTGTIAWLASQLQPFALKPGGTELWMVFWSAAALGFLLARRRSALPLFFGLVPLAGFLWAGLRLVPLYERLSLWMLPALYVGIALCVEGAARLIHRSFTRRNWLGLGAAVVMGIVGVIASFDIFHGFDLLLYGRPASNHLLDDRAGVRWLMSQRQGGDAFVTSYFGLAAVWWYGPISIGMPRNPGSRLPEGGPILEVGYVFRPCDAGALRDALKDQKRVLVYMGFRFDDVPRGFDDLVFLRMREMGTITAYREFGEWSKAAIVDLRPEAADVAVPATTFVGPLLEAGRLDGCLSVKRGRRW